MTDLLVLSPMLILRHIIRKILSTLSKGDVDVIIVGFIILWAVGLTICLRAFLLDVLFLLINLSL